MIIVPLIPFRRRRKGGPVPQTPAALTLMSASYDETAAALTLAFDRAIDIAAFVPAAVIVADGVFTVTVYGGVGTAALLSPTTLSVALEWIADAEPGPPVTLTATALTGLVAVDDGGTWAGVTELGLPFDG